MTLAEYKFLRGARPSRVWTAGSIFLVFLALSGCAVGPHYSRPSAPVSPAYKETPENWKQAQPADQFAHGKWWEIYQDAELNALEEKIEVSNQSLKAAQAQFEQARAFVGSWIRHPAHQKADQLTVLQLAS